MKENGLKGKNAYVLEFVKSKAMRQYLDNLELSIIEAASIVNVINRDNIELYWRNKLETTKPISINEKYKIFEKILKDFPNKNFYEKGEKYLADEYLKKYIEWEMVEIDSFKDLGTDLPFSSDWYSYKIFEKGQKIDLDNFLKEESKHKFESITDRYFSFDSCISTIKNESKNITNENFIVLVFKCSCEYGDFTQAILNKNCDFLQILPNRYYSLAEFFDDCTDLHGLTNMYFIPLLGVPFSDGDLVINVNNPNNVMLFFERNSLIADINNQESNEILKNNNDGKVLTNSNKLDTKKVVADRQAECYIDEEDYCDCVSGIYPNRYYAGWIYLDYHDENSKINEENKIYLDYALQCEETRKWIAQDYRENVKLNG